MPAERNTRPRGGGRGGRGGYGGNGRGRGAHGGHGQQNRNARAGPSTTPTGEKKHTVPSLQERDGLMGVSKLKSQIRQTKRLLAKDTIEPGLRVATERRLTSLEGDLARAEQRGVEKKNGVKYHAVKFFERQKLVRVIKRCVREVAELSEGKEEGSSKKDKKLAKKEKELETARVMLNYIIHFPNTHKYIALFAEKAADDKDDEDETAAKVKLPKYLDEEPEADTPAATRQKILIEMRRLMAEGKIAAEPENESREHVYRDRRGVGVGPGEVQLNLGDDKEGKEDKADKAEDEGEDEDDFFDDD